MRRAFALLALVSPLTLALPALAAPPPPPPPSPTTATPPARPPLPAPAPGDTSAPLTSSFQHKPRSPADTVDLQLEDADLGELVRVIGELTGKRFVIASPKLAKTKASIYAPQKVTVSEAYQAFLAVLSANGLTVVPQAGFLKIVESQDIARQLTPIERGALTGEERYVTRIHRLEHLTAEAVATDVLSKLATKDASIVPYAPGNLLIMTETSANLRRMIEVLDAIDAAGEEDKLYLQPLHYLPAAQVEKQLTEILELKKAAPSGGALHVARIVAIDRPNALVVVATRGSYERILKILAQVDVAPDNESQVRVVLLQHADAKKIVGPINEALGGSGGGSGGGSSAAGPGGAGGAARSSALPNAPAAVLEASAKVSADETTNALIVTATPRDFAPIKAVIDALDRPKRQVFIEAVVLDVSSEHGLDLGVAWHVGSVNSSALGAGSQTTYGGFRPLTSAGAPSSTELQAFALGVRGPDIPFLAGIPGVSTIPSFGVLLSAMATSKAADILSTPHIIASDNTPAEIKVQLNTSLQPNAPQTSILPTGVGAANVGSTVANNYRPIGPRIKVTPHLNDSDQVRLDVDEMISDVQSAPDKADTYGTLSYLERTATTTLTVKDGETIVIGGLVRNRVTRSETKVPILGDIPLLGALFRTRKDTMEKSNLILVLTPHIIRDSSDLRRIFERKMQERQELMDRESIFTNDHWKAPVDFSRTRGLLGEVRLAQREVALRQKELDETPQPTVLGVAAQPALDLPVPQAPASGVKAPTSPGAPSGGATPARPTVIER